MTQAPNYDLFYIKGTDEYGRNTREEAQIFENLNIDKKQTILKGKGLRKGLDDNSLFVNTGKTIKLFFGLWEDGETYKQDAELKQFDDSEIEDFRVLGTYGHWDGGIGVLTACTNMQVYYHELHPKRGSRMVCKIDSGIDIKERITCLSVCSKNR